MTRQAIKQQILRHISPMELNEWDEDELVDALLRLSTEQRQDAIGMIPVIWPVSHALCLAFIDQAGSALTCIDRQQFGQWTQGVLAAYEKGGLIEARAFMNDTEKNFLCRLRGEAGITFDAVVRRLQPYVRGLAGRDLLLVPNDRTRTDTEHIFLPHEFTLFPSQEENFLLFKLTASYQWGFSELGSLTPPIDADHPLSLQVQKKYRRPLAESGGGLEDFFALFPEPQLAQELYHIFELARLTGFLNQELPGLLRDAVGLVAGILNSRPALAQLSERERELERIRQWTLLLLADLDAKPPAIIRPAIDPILVELRAPPKNTLVSLRAAADLYPIFDRLTAGQSAVPLPHQGYLAPREAALAATKRRQVIRNRFIENLAALLRAKNELPPDPEAEELLRDAKSAKPSQDEPTAGLAPEKSTGDQPFPTEAAAETSEFIVIDDELIAMPETLRQIHREIRQDLGQVPEQYISSAKQLAGRGIAKGPGPNPGTGKSLGGPMTYDEWDYRRAGFRKDWCRLVEKELLPVKSNFVAITREKHQGVLRQLRRQFEMMRTQQKFANKQTDGNDIDLDALTDSLADARAGLGHSERVFIRLLRDERDIATIFLIDMSSSTEGWVSTALKESLVLLCEALDILGDRYALYGFSGMRRMRSEWYHIKHFNERYDDETRGRIGAITPREYTRMGPPIRHAGELLKKTEARTKLLITLSDGKPEDYDDYKADYAIEDTRHALIEVKAAGIHPFCITIDQHAHDYMPHMYGAVNYAFIREVSSLPRRIPQIYRTLTT